MDTRKLGTQGLEVAEIGLGCMGMSEFYGSGDDSESIATIHRALELGVTLLDTADIYGPHTNERLVGKALKGRRDQVVLATKFGIVRDPDDPTKRSFNGRPEYVRSAAEASLQRLEVDHIDLYYQHRVDHDVPVEETFGAMAELVSEGKVRYLGISEAKPETIRRAHAVHPLSALQSEYSLWTRDPEAEILQTIRELGIGLVAYSPLGRGFLTGAITKPEDLGDDDFRAHNPRFAEQAFAANMKIVDAVKEVAGRHNASPAQVAIAWTLAQGDDVVPIPGTKRRKYLEQNIAAALLKLTDDDLKSLAELPAPTGDRYPNMEFVNR
ncbi:MAG: aldo/keto reductase [Solirubrobacterales bacterium]|nr:aldo/keto reductase [Solirubrobacterales bacterium]